MIEVDFHSHTFCSSCGMHTHIEMLEHAKSLGLAGLAITDHGRSVGGRLNSAFFKRFENPVKGIRLLKGVECNLLDLDGNIDCPMEYMEHLDIILLGFHGNVEKNLGIDCYTQMMLNSIEKNPFVDIITHPIDQWYPMDMERLVASAKKFDKVIELNDAKLRLGHNSQGDVERLLRICLNMECPIALCSDAHVLNEIGSDKYSERILKNVGFPEELIVNSDVEKAFDYIERRRILKNFK